jgi:hypothetical protein
MVQKTGKTTFLDRTKYLNRLRDVQDGLSDLKP